MTQYQDIQLALLHVGSGAEKPSTARRLSRSLSTKLAALKPGKQAPAEPTSTVHHDVPSLPQLNAGDFSATARAGTL